MAISMMKVYGILSGVLPGKEQKSGLNFTKVTLMFESGKKHDFKVYGPFSGLGNAVWGDKVTVIVDTPELSTFGEMSSYGDCSWKCAGMRLFDEKANSSAPPISKAA